MNNDDFWGLGQELGSSILDHLKAVQGCLTKTSGKGIAIIKIGGNEHMYNHLHLSYRHNGPEFSKVSQLVERGANQTIYMLVKTQSLAHKNAQITEG